MDNKQDPEVKLSVVKKVLDDCFAVGYINEYAKHRIMNLLKKHYDTNSNK